MGLGAGSAERRRTTRPGPQVDRADVQPDDIFRAAAGQHPPIAGNGRSVHHRLDRRPAPAVRCNRIRPRRYARRLDPLAAGQSAKSLGPRRCPRRSRPISSLPASAIAGFQNRRLRLRAKAVIRRTWPDWQAWRADQRVDARSRWRRAARFGPRPGTRSKASTLSGVSASGSSRIAIVPVETRSAIFGKVLTDSLSRSGGGRNLPESRTTGSGRSWIARAVAVGADAKQVRALKFKQIATCSNLAAISAFVIILRRGSRFGCDRQSSSILQPDASGPMPDDQITGLAAQGRTARPSRSAHPRKNGPADGPPSLVNGFPPPGK